MIENGYKVEYKYKLNGVVENRIGYVKFMENASNGLSKFEFVGTNLEGQITAYHVESKMSFWRMLNGENTKIIIPIE